MSAALQPKKDHARTMAVQRKAETLGYVREMLRELRDMSNAEGEQFVTYLIGMAYIATSDVIRERYSSIVSDSCQSPTGGL